MLFLPLSRHLLLVSLLIWYASAMDITGEVSEDHSTGQEEEKCTNSPGRILASLGAVLLTVVLSGILVWVVSAFYKTGYIQSIFQGTAVGALTGDALLHLIPNALGIHLFQGDETHEDINVGQAKAVFWLVLVGIAVMLVSDRLVHAWLKRRRDRKDKELLQLRKLEADRTAGSLSPHQGPPPPPREPTTSEGFRAETVVEFEVPEAGSGAFTNDTTSFPLHRVASGKLLPPCPLPTPHGLPPASYSLNTLGSLVGVSTPSGKLRKLGSMTASFKRRGRENDDNDTQHLSADYTQQMQQEDNKEDLTRGGRSPQSSKQSTLNGAHNGRHPAQQGSLTVEIPANNVLCGSVDLDDSECPVSLSGEDASVAQTTTTTPPLTSRHMEGGEGGMSAIELDPQSPDVPDVATNSQALIVALLVADTIHNTVDGIALATSFYISYPLGGATLVAILLHEIPQELCDACNLMTLGLSTKKVFWLNILTGLTSVLGWIVSIGLVTSFQEGEPYILAFTGGCFLYLALGDITSFMLHWNDEHKTKGVDMLGVVIGIAFMVLVGLVDDRGEC